MKAVVPSMRWALHPVGTASPHEKQKGVPRRVIEASEVVCKGQFSVCAKLPIEPVSGVVCVGLAGALPEMPLVAAPVPVSVGAAGRDGAWQSSAKGQAVASRLFGDGDRVFDDASQNGVDLGVVVSVLSVPLC